jgi:hypothetical protein
VTVDRSWDGCMPVKRVVGHTLGVDRLHARAELNDVEKLMAKASGLRRDSSRHLRQTSN